MRAVKAFALAVAAGLAVFAVQPAPQAAMKTALNTAPEPRPVTTIYDLYLGGITAGELTMARQTGLCPGAFPPRHG